MAERKISDPEQSRPVERRSHRSSDGASLHRRDRGKVKPKFNSRAAESACIWKDVRFKGEIIIGDRTIMGPGCCCISHGGSIKIGNQNVFTECVQIVNKSEDQPMEIGNLNIFETGAKVEARKVGSYNQFGAKSYVMAGCTIGNGCVIGPRVQVVKNSDVTDYTIMAGENLIQTQKAFKHRNSLYVQKMVKLLSRQFHLMKDKNKSKDKVKKKQKPRAYRSDGRSSSSRISERRLEPRTQRRSKTSPKNDGTSKSSNVDARSK